MIGRTVAYYRITAKLSDGGMGEVCLAKLRRVPAAFAAGAGHRSLRAGGQDTRMAPDALAGALRLFCRAGLELDQLPRGNEERHPNGLPAWRFESSALRHIRAWRAVLRHPHAHRHFVGLFEGILCHPLPGQRVGTGDFNKPSDYLAVSPFYVQMKEGVRIDPFDPRNDALKRNEL